MPIVEIPLMRRLVEAILRNCGQDETDARVTANWLIEADLRKVHSHGLARLPTYVRCFGDGIMNPRPKMSVSTLRAGATHIDGGDGIGAVVASRAMTETLGKARQTGSATTLVMRSSHYGMASYFLKPALDEGMIAITGSNGPPTMAPWGARDAALGTNPLAIGFPGGDRYGSLVLDMATSTVARGKIKVIAQEGGTLPEGWALDRSGAPTCDPRAALEGVVLPFAGAKGSGLAAAIDILAGVVSGASFGLAAGNVNNPEKKPVNLGHFFIVIDTAAFLPAEDYRSRFDQFISMLKSAAPAPGFDSVSFPGERSEQTRRQSLETGLQLSESVLRDLTQLASEVPELAGLPAEWHLTG